MIEKKEGDCAKCGIDLGKKKGMWLPYDSLCSTCVNEWIEEK